jgi:hypothetical protein
MNRSHVLAAAVALAVLGSTSHADAAGDANGFSQKGQFIVSADRLFSFFSYTNISVSGDNTTTSENATSIALLWGQEPGPNLGGITDPHTVPRVAFDYTVIDHLTIGGSLVLAFGLGGKNETKTGNVTRSTDSPTTTLIGISPRVGYVIPVGDILAIWPRGGFTFYSASAKTKQEQNNNTVTTTTTASQLSLDLDPQLAGPLVNIPLTGSASVKTESGGTTREVSNDLSIFHMGISTGIGGWFDL